MPKAPRLGESDIDYKSNVGQRVALKKVFTGIGATRLGRITAVNQFGDEYTYTIRFDDGTRQSGFDGDQFVHIAEAVTSSKNPWIYSTAVGGYHSEASTLQAYGAKGEKCPTCNNALPNNMWKPKMRDSEITMWEGNCPSCKKKFVVYND
jgi:hypothetical protein